MSWEDILKSAPSARGLGTSKSKKTLVRDTREQVDAWTDRFVNDNRERIAEGVSIETFAYPKRSSLGWRMWIIGYFTKDGRYYLDPLATKEFDFDAFKGRLQ